MYPIPDLPAAEASTSTQSSFVPFQSAVGLGEFGRNSKGSDRKALDRDRMRAAAHCGLPLKGYLNVDNGCMLSMYG